KLALADWDSFAADCEILFRNVENGLPATAPGHLLALPSTPALQQRAAEIYARDNILLAQPQGEEAREAKSSPVLTAPVPATRNVELLRNSNFEAASKNLGGRDRPGHDGIVGVGAKITVAYFSCDFRNHPLSQLMAGLFEMHDRSRFTIVGFSYGGKY